MSTTATAPASLIDDAQFLAQLDALDRQGPDAGADADQAGGSGRDDWEPQASDQELQRERKRPFWEERMREGAAAFNELQEPEPEPIVPPTGISRAAAAIGLVLCTAAGAGAAALVFHERLAHLLR
jgi:hypothetical protein